MLSAGGGRLTGVVFRIICAAFLCTLLGAIGSSGPAGRLRKLMAGIFLMLTVLQPVTRLELPELDLESIRAEARDAVREGQSVAALEKNARITEALESYIWNKASGMGLDLQVRVRVGEDGMPNSVELTGDLSPEQQENLSECIARELGLGKEAQIWITPYQSSE